MADLVEIELDGRKVEVPPGSMVMHAAEKVGAYIPHFCYHKKLSIAASCRMCLVDVEKAPKALPACATPVTQGMIVRTKSERAVKAQQSVMEFLLVNHPLDCPVCDQGGECQLQDLAVGYGAGQSRYIEEKRVVSRKDVGPLISMEEMSRCIHCTRCVRFGQEIAGDMELGMINRGEHSEITTIKGDWINSELSGNMIDICPVGALTSRPFRYNARTWELSRRKSISPHDSTGANLIVQVKNHRVMRVVPFENEEVNECWIADRDRFSYEALNSPDRLLRPMIKQGGEWQEVEWQTALEYVANGLKDITSKNGSQSVGALASPHSTLEEIFLLKEFLGGLGSFNLDWRLRHSQFLPFEGVRWLGTSVASLSDMHTVLMLGSNVRKDHPLFAQRLRQSVRKGAKVFAINEYAYDCAMDIAQHWVAPVHEWTQALAEIASAVAHEKGILPPQAGIEPSTEAHAIALALLKGEKKAIFLGNAAQHHSHAAELLAFANWIGEHVGATVGYFVEAANTVGAQWMGAYPSGDGLNAFEMLEGRLQALFLLNTEPVFDSMAGEAVATNLQKVNMVVTLSPFKANMEYSDVLLPVAPFTETSGSFVNAEGRLQSFHAVVKPLAETRPAWKVIRVLANLLGLQGFNYQSSQDVLERAVGKNVKNVPTELLKNSTEVVPSVRRKVVAKPTVAGIYQLDGLVRRSPSLQNTQDAKMRNLLVCPSVEG